jgi:Protein of unknown function (DUF1559)
MIWEEYEMWQWGWRLRRDIFHDNSSGRARPAGAQRVYMDMVYPEIIPGWIVLTSQGWLIDDVTQGKTNYLACSGLIGEISLSYYDQRVGVFSVRSTTTVAQIVDGTSHTVLFGEAAGTVGNDIDEVGQRRTGLVRAYSWIGAATLPVAFGLDPKVNDGSPNPEARYDAHWTQFSSLHPGIVHVCLADGSVQAIRREIDQPILEALAGRSEGDPDSSGW